MKYEKFGKTDMEVSTICLGTWVFGGDCWGEACDEESVEVVKEAVDKGINFIDTAPIYGSGRSEEIVGKGIKGKRDSLFIATKCGLKMKGKGIEVDLSPSFVREEVEESLKRLGTEVIDLYQCHWPDEKTPFEETFGELNKLKEEGKIKYIGVSNFSEEQTLKALKYSEVVSNQVQYSLLDRRIEESLMPLSKEKEVAILPYGALGGGILTGKYKEPPLVKKGDVKDFFYQYYKEPYWSKAKRLVSILEEIASSHSVPTSHVAINWVLSHSEVPSCIAGCRNARQLEGNVGASNWSLSREEVSLIEEEYRKIF